MQAFMTTTFLETGVQRFVKKRSILLYQGEVPHSGFVVLNGCMKVYKINSDGEEQIVGFRTSGDIFPETWLMRKTAQALYYYEALEDSEVVTFDRETLHALITQHPETQTELLDYFVNSHTGLLMQVTALGQSRAADKILFMLAYLLFRYGKKAQPDMVSVSVPMTHTLLGCMLGLSRETTSVELGKLRRKKVVAYNSKEFIINKPLLQQKLGEDSGIV